MKNEAIATVLKEYRKKNGLSVREVVAKLGEKSLFISEKTLYGWESGQAQPDADTLLMLCEIYKIDDILGSFGYCTATPIPITTLEKDIVTRLRKHPEMLPAIKKLLDL